MQKVASVTVDGVALEGEPVVCSEPGYTSDFPEAAMVSHVLITSECVESEVRWTLHMQNGDTICLRQKVCQSVLEELECRPEAYPMETAEQLQSLVDQLVAETTDRTCIKLYLPCVVYEEPVNFYGREVQLIGSREGDAVTTFTETVCFTWDVKKLFFEIWDVAFLGQGGTGVEAKAAVTLYNCTIQGWDDGILATEGGNVVLQDCVLQENRYGVHYNTNHYYMSTAICLGNWFRNNEVAVFYEALPGESVMSYDSCVFSGNGENVRNPIHYSVDLSGAVVE